MAPSLRSLVALTALLLATSSAWAQTGGLRGFVTGADDGQPLIGATVLAAPLAADGSLDGEPRGAAADVDGLYVIPRLSVGRYLVRVSYVGYETEIDTLTIDAEACGRWMPVEYRMCAPQLISQGPEVGLGSGLGLGLRIGFGLERQYRRAWGQGWAQG